MRVRKTTRVFGHGIHGYTEMAALTSTPLFWFGYLCVVLFVSAGEKQKQHSSLTYEPELYNNTLFKYYPSIPIMFETLALISPIETILGTPGNRTADGLMLTPFLRITKSDFLL